MNAKRVALHESGHCLIGWYFGYSLRTVTINPQPGEVPEMGGVCRASPPGGRTDIFCDPVALTAAQVYFSIAGRLADDLFFPAEPDGSGKDFRDIIEMLPADDVTLLMHKFDRKNNTIEDFYKQFKAPVEKIFRSRKGRKALKSLSAALLNAGTLSGAEVVNILEKAWKKPFPAKAKPAADHCTIKSRGLKTYDGLLQSLSSFLSVMFDDIEKQRLDFKESENDHLGRIRHAMLIVKMQLSK